MTSSVGQRRYGGLLSRVSQRSFSLLLWRNRQNLETWGEGKLLAVLDERVMTESFRTGTGVDCKEREAFYLSMAALSNCALISHWEDEGCIGGDESEVSHDFYVGSVCEDKYFKESGWCKTATLETRGGVMHKGCRAPKLRVAELSGFCLTFLAKEDRQWFILSMVDMNVLLVAAETILVPTSRRGCKTDPDRLIYILWSSCPATQIFLWNLRWVL